MSLQRALFLLIAIALLAGLVPAGIVLDRRLATELERKSREDLVLAPRLLADREEMKADALMMHAKDLAATPGLVDVLLGGERERAKKRSSSCARRKRCGAARLRRRRLSRPHAAAKCR
jgi:hypothetical protein